MTARGRVLLASILGLALALRVVYVLQSRASPAILQPSMDALYHLEWAQAFARGEGFQPAPFFRAPLYPWFLGLCLRVFGEDLLLARLVQAAIGTASVGLVFLVGRRAFGTATGLLASLFASLAWIVIYFEGELLLPVLEIFFDLLAILLTLRIADRPTVGRAALAGLAWGVAAIVRPNVLLLAPLVVVWAALRARREGSGRLAVPLALLLGLAAPIAPITAYNRLAGGDWVLISSQGGVNFWIGNNPRSDGATAIVPGTRADWWGGYHDSIRMAEAAEGRSLRPSEVSRHFAGEAWSWIRSEPAAALRHALWKLRLFLTDWEIGNNASERFLAHRYGPILRALPLGFGLLAPLALLGLLLTARSAGRILPLWAFVPVYGLSVVAFFVCSRFRVPVLPVMAVFAAQACVEIVGFARARRVAALAACALFLAAAVALVESVPRAIDRSDAKGLWALGVLAQQRGDRAEAIALYRQSIAENPRFAKSQMDLGLALRAAGETAEAEERLRAAVALDPGDAVARSLLVDLLASAGRLDEALALAEENAARAPLYAPGRYDLGRLLEQKARGVPAQARELRERAAAECLEAARLATDEPTAFHAALAAGNALALLGRPEQALAAFESALCARPERPASGPDAALWWWRCQAGVAGALDALGRREEALARVAELLRRYPDDPAARALAAR